MTKLVNYVCQACNLQNVVDLGAGEGYISHTLTVDYQLKVAAVECNNDTMVKGESRAKRLDQVRMRKDHYQEANLILQYLA